MTEKDDTLETLVTTETDVLPDPEDIPSDDEIKRSVKKKAAALKARQTLEKYFEEKAIREALDYISPADLHDKEK